MRQRLVPIGYFLMFLPPVMVIAGSFAGLPWLAFVLFVAASPLTRALFGTYPPNPPVMSERMASLLHALPGAYVVVLFACLPLAAAQLNTVPVSGAWSLTCFGLSLWTALVFGTFPAHEMVHRRDKVWVYVGSFAAGLCGYPILGLEHAVHHERAGNVSSAEWPARAESMWTFAARRLVAATKNAIERNSSLKGTGAWGVATPLAVGVLGFACAAGTFWWFGATKGILLYGCAAAGVAFSMQVMTFVQHWGLGEDSIEGSGEKELAWEDDCLMQAWITLNNSFHQSHHQARDSAYFFVAPALDSPRQPGCYVVLLFASLVPAVWRSLMYPVLDQWKADGSLVCQPGRRVICIAPSRRA